VSSYVEEEAGVEAAHRLERGASEHRGAAGEAEHVRIAGLGAVGTEPVAVRAGSVECDDVAGRVDQRDVCLVARSIEQDLRRHRCHIAGVGR